MSLQKKNEFYALLSLIHTKGLGPRRCKAIVDFYGSAQKAVEKAKDWKSDLSIPEEIIKNFLSRSWIKSANKEFDLFQRSNINVLLYTDPKYPDLLKEIPDPPPYLYYIGNLDLLKRPCIAVVGSRICSKTGKELSFSISKELSSLGICVVSGFALGIDREAHLGALEEKGSSIAVLGCGLDIIYPARNKDVWLKLKEKGLILTEFSIGTSPEGNNFPRRNRIISGMSYGVVVIEAKERSGSLITARLGIEQGRMVFAVPSSPSSLYQGTNKLIKEGATLITSAKEIVEELAFILNRENSQNPSIEEHDNEIKEDLSTEERMVLNLLKEREKLHIDEISKNLDWPSCKASEILLLLELKGMVVQLPGTFYTLKRL